MIQIQTQQRTGELLVVRRHYVGQDRDIPENKIKLAVDSVASTNSVGGKSLIFSGPQDPHK